MKKLQEQVASLEQQLSIKETDIVKMRRALELKDKELDEKRVELSNIRGQKEGLEDQALKLTQRLGKAEVGGASG